MGFLVDDEDEIGRDDIGLLVSLLQEGDLRALFPSRFHLDCKDLLHSRGPPGPWRDSLVSDQFNATMINEIYQF